MASSYIAVAVGVHRFWSALSSLHWGSRYTYYHCTTWDIGVIWMQYMWSIQTRIGAMTIPPCSLVLCCTIWTPYIIITLKGTKVHVIQWIRPSMASKNPDGVPVPCPMCRRYFWSAPSTLNWWYTHVTLFACSPCKSIHSSRRMEGDATKESVVCESTESVV